MSVIVARQAPELVGRDFAARPDRLWVADITYIPTWAGLLYLVVVLDAWSRRVIGSAMATHLRTALMLEHGLGVRPSMACVGDSKPWPDAQEVHGLRNRAYSTSTA